MWHPTQEPYHWRKRKGANHPVSCRLLYQRLPVPGLTEFRRLEGPSDDVIQCEMTGMMTSTKSTRQRVVTFAVCLSPAPAAVWDADISADPQCYCYTQSTGVQQGAEVS